MRLKISDSLRLRISQKYLNLAGKLPQANEGQLAGLQMIRKQQRKQSKEDHEESQPPDGVEISVLYLRLFEMFQIEEFSAFYKRFLRFYPDLAAQRNYGLNKTDISESFPSGNEISSVTLGTITNKINQHPKLGVTYFGNQTIDDPNLPNKIARLDIGLRRVLPSIFIVTFDIYLTEDANRELLNLQKGYYMREIMLLDLMPRNAWIPHTSSYYSSSLSAKAISHWFQKLQTEVEKYLKPMLGGFFLSTKGNEFPVSLPSIEVFALQGAPAPDNEEDFKEWMLNNRKWLSSYGYTPFSRTLYASDKTLVDLVDNSQQQVLARIIAFDEANVGNETSSSPPLSFKTLYLVNDLIPFLSVYSFLGSVEGGIERLRDDLFAQTLSRKSLLNLFRVTEQVIKRKNLIDTLMQEFDSWKNLFGIRHSDELQQLENIQLKGDTKEQKLLITEFVLWIEFRAAQIQSRVSLLENTLSDFLALRNMETIHKLQWRAAWAGIIAVVISVLAIVVALTVNSSFR